MLNTLSMLGGPATAAKGKSVTSDPPLSQISVPQHIPSLEDAELSSTPESPLGSTPDSSVHSVSIGRDPLSTSSPVLQNAPSTTAHIASQFTHNINDTVLSSQANLLVKDFSTSLAENSNITMLPNYNISPTGEEFGDFLCIDLGGSTLRIAVVSIDPPSSQSDPSADAASRVHVIVEKQWTIANDFKTIDTNFFRFIASRIEEILRSQSVIPAESPIIKTGITWSFPLKTTSHNNGNIVHVSKGYSVAPEIYDRDLKSILETILKDEYAINIDIKIILNDSLAVYSAGSFLDKYMKLALVLGTGFNVCCALENGEAIHPDKRWSNETSGTKTLFNGELSLFGEQMLPYLPTKYDYVIEPRFENFQFNYKSYMTTDPTTESILQPTELMCSGRYLPELTRLVLVDLIEEKEIFTGLSHSQLDPILNDEYDGVNGELVCYIAETDDVEEIVSKLSETYGWSADSISHADIATLKNIIGCIVQRAAFIVAISFVALIKLLNLHNSEEETHDRAINIGYVGSVITYFDSYRELIKHYVNSNDAIQKLGVTVDFKLVENSSIIGAAIGAAYYS